MNIIHILWGTPWWVWALLSSLIISGIKSLKTHTLSFFRLFIRPIIFTIWSGWSFYHNHSTSCFYIGIFIAIALIGAAIGWLLTPSHAVDVDSQKKNVTLPGSWYPLLSSIVFFIIKYSIGVAYAILPGMQSNAVLHIIDIVTSGFISGNAWGRCLSIVKRVFA